mmetsp:Transcript_24468/g.34507  ORF Transcript_24468/g.34507 Transcript_24468/m.34507 type:complete len:341 (-) Transcript_24468:164-1186(-)
MLTSNKSRKQQRWLVKTPGKTVTVTTPTMTKHVRLNVSKKPAWTTASKTTTTVKSSKLNVSWNVQNSRIRTTITTATTITCTLLDPTALPMDLKFILASSLMRPVPTGLAPRFTPTTTMEMLFPTVVNRLSTLTAFHACNPRKKRTTTTTTTTTVQESSSSDSTLSESNNNTANESEKNKDEDNERKEDIATTASDQDKENQPPMYDNSAVSPPVELMFAKNKTKIQIPAELSLDKFYIQEHVSTTSDDKNSMKSSSVYKLQSMVHHIGSTADSGHYTADALRTKGRKKDDDDHHDANQQEEEQEWVSFDDGVTSVVKTPILENERKQRTAYMLLYTLQE